MTERVWIILAGAMLFVAVAFVWRNNMSGAFVTATLGAVAWFLSYRAQMRARVVAAEEKSSEPEIGEEPDEN
jgi:hypothetical protein